LFTYFIFHQPTTTTNEEHKYFIQFNKHQEAVEESSSPFTFEEEVTKEKEKEKEAEFLFNTKQAKENEVIFIIKVIFKGRK